MSRGGLVRRFPVLAIRDFRLLLADRLIAPASVGFSMVGVSFAVLQGHELRHRPVLRTRRPDRAVAGVRAHRRRGGRPVPAAAGDRRGQPAHGAGRGNIRRARADRPSAAVGDDRAGGDDRDRDGVVLPGLAGTAPPPGPPRPAAGGQRDQPDGDEHRPDVRCGRGWPAGGGVGPGWALLLCGTGMVGTVPMLLSIRGCRHDPVRAESRLTASSMLPNCARAGRSSVRTPGCG